MELKLWEVNVPASNWGGFRWLMLAENKEIVKEVLEDFNGGVLPVRFSIKQIMRPFYNGQVLCFIDVTQNQWNKYRTGFNKT